MSAERISGETCPSCGADVDFSGRDETGCPKCGVWLQVDDSGEITTQTRPGQAIKGEDRTGVPGAGDRPEPTGHP